MLLYSRRPKYVCVSFHFVGNSRLRRRGTIVNTYVVCCDTLKETMAEEAKDKKCDVWLIDTSPFYAGGTHLAWCAVEALVTFPVRVDEHSDRIS